jgi:hypothetical protein
VAAGSTVSAVSTFYLIERPPLMAPFTTETRANVISIHKSSTFDNVDMARLLACFTPIPARAVLKLS